MNAKSTATLAEHLRAEAAHDAAAAAACYHDDGWYQHEAFNLRFDGRDGVELQYGLSYEAFPDLAFEIDEQVSGENVIVQRGRFRGTFAGSLFGLEPTGRLVDVPMAAFYEFREGLILSERIVMDLAVFADQTGLDFAELQRALDIETSASRAWDAVKRYAAAKSRADVDAALAECTDDFELCTVPFGITSFGLDESRAGLGLWFTAFPDYNVTVDGHLASHRTVTCWGTIRATMRGNLGPFAGTGLGYELAFSCIFDIRDGRIQREEFHFDLAKMASQLGMDPTATAQVLGIAVAAT